MKYLALSMFLLGAINSQSSSGRTYPHPSLPSGSYPSLVYVPSFTERVPQVNNLPTFKPVDGSNTIPGVGHNSKNMQITSSPQTPSPFSQETTFPSLTKSYPFQNSPSKKPKLTQTQSSSCAYSSLRSEYGQDDTYFRRAPQQTICYQRKTRRHC